MSSRGNNNRPAANKRNRRRSNSRNAPSYEAALTQYPTFSAITNALMRNGEMRSVKSLLGVSKSTAQYWPVTKKTFTMEARIAVYQKAFNDFGDGLYTATQEELVKRFGKGFFPKSWTRLLRASDAAAALEYGFNVTNMTAPDDYQLIDLTELFANGEYRNLEALQEEARALGARTTLLSENDWKNLWALYVVAHEDYARRLR